MTQYLTIPGVELLTVGMKWPASSGDLTFTFEHLADAMEAGNNDPHIVAPRLKLGHVDPRFNDGAGDHDPFWDGEPAFGRVENFRLENDGAVLVGDYVEVPDWLAEAMPSAYPNRSIEGAYVDGNWDVETPGGKRYSFVLTACAILGLSRPAVQDLEDLERLLVDGEGLVVTGGEAASATLDDVKQPKASADVDKVIDVLIRDWIEDPDHPERYWWWPRAVWTDPNEVIVDDDDGGCWAVPFTSNDQSEVTFSAEREVREVYLDVPSGAPAARQAADRGDAAAVFASRTDEKLVKAGLRKRENTPVSGRGQAGGTVASMNDALRKALGLDEDATEEDALAKVEELKAEAPEPTDDDVGEGGSEGADPPTPEPHPGAPEKDEGEAGPSGDAEPTPEPEPATASTVTVDKEEWERTKGQAKEGAAARNEQRTERRETMLAEAVKAGKFPPSRKDHYRDLHKADPEGTEALIDSLEKGVIPTEARGTEGDPDGESAGYDRVKAAVLGNGAPEAKS